MSEQAPEQSPVKPSLAERALVLHMNGWWPAFVVTYALFIGEALRDGAAFPLLLGGGLISMAVACLFSLAVGPLLCRWRAREDKRGFLALSALLCFGLIVWAALNLGLMLSVATRFFGGWGTTPKEELLNAFDNVLEILGRGAMVSAWLAGMAVCWLGRETLRRHQGWTYAGAVPWRRVLGVTLLIPYALLLLTAAATVWEGARLDPSLTLAYQSDITTAIQQKGLSPEERLRSQLPSGFRESSVVAAWLRHKTLTIDQQNSVLGLWCKEAAGLWSVKDAWNDPRLVALARLATVRSIVEDSRLRPADRAEVAVRSEVVLIEWGGVSPTQSQRLYETALPAVTWQRLVELALSRDDLLRGASLTDVDVRDKFVEAAVKVVSKSDYDMDGKLQRRFFRGCGERAQLNGLWHAYEKGKPYPVADTPPNLEQFKHRYASSLAFDLTAVDEDITQVTFKEDLARQGLAYDIVLMELKRLEAEKALLPRTWSEFRPEVGAIGNAYADWLLLTPSPNGVTLRRKDPRHGESLSHRFKS